MTADHYFFKAQNPRGSAQQQADCGKRPGNDRFLRVNLFFERQARD